MSKTASRRTISDLFGAVAQATSQKLGHPGSFVAAAMVVLVWGALGPACRYSDTWQLVINTGTTIVTFLMVFLIQNTQNRDMTMLHLKLDELIRVNASARDRLLNLEDVTEDELVQIKKSFEKLSTATVKQARRK